MGMRNYSNEELLSGILRNDNRVLLHIYKTYYNRISSLIIRNSGNEDDANDVFQEAIIVIFRKLKEDNLTLIDCAFETYLYSVCRLLWLKQLEKKRKNIVQLEDVMQYSESIYDSDMFELIKKNERYRLYQGHFEELGQECQKILRLFFDKVPLKKIAEIMGLSSEGYAKKRKHQCKEILVKKIKQDEEFKNYFYDDL
jgi:RNA polymerase sigma factor (sigma-70 family)